ncbi:MAG: peptidoglycan-binding protein [Candidatus Pacebacteria bacterium]|nr:peptidoglycan-binding protein [Candidatus Paceibacterota bacterium]
MSKKAILIRIGIAIFAVPLLSLAATVGSSAVGSAATGGTACFPFSRSLSVGARGSDVAMLQDYLGQQGYLNVSSTGYFGVLTNAAVGKWQAQNNIAALGASGNGTFGPLSRAYFMQSCGTGVGAGSGNSSGTAQSFSANPQSGITPLTVQFTSTAPQGSDVGNAVDFGDGATGTLGFVPVCSSCNAMGIVSHTYTATGTYAATLTSGVCNCPANGICGCPNIRILATTTVAVGSATGTTGTATSSIRQLNAPGVVTLSPGGIAEIRNEGAYFTLQTIASSSATIQITPVGCWNWFPSDPPSKIVCMIALVPIPPQTLTLGQTYSGTNYSITLTQLGDSTATFSVNTK